MQRTNLVLALRLVDPAKAGDIWTMKVAKGIAFDDAVWVGVIRQVPERDDGQRVTDELSV